jgi:hypothetical protein
VRFRALFTYRDVEPDVARIGPEGLVPSRNRDRDSIYLELIADELKPLILPKSDRAGVRWALLFARGILNIDLHEVLDRFMTSDQCLCVLGVIVHKDVMAFLRVYSQTN